MVLLEPHEAIRWEAHDVDVRLNSTSGSTIKLSQAHICLTNRYIHIASPRTHTYKVVNRGDRNFSPIKIPILSAKPHRFVQPWFGPYKWETQIQPPNTFDIEPREDNWALILIFSNGGVFNYRKSFLQTFAEASQAASEGIDEVLPPYTES